MKHINLKSIFATFLLLVGVCQVSWGWNWTGKTLYFDNSQTNWEEVYVIIGHDNDNGYSRAYQMTKRPNSTLYELTISFDNYDRFFISSTKGNVSTEDDGNHPKITTAETACSLRTQSIRQSVESDILIEVSGTNSPYSINTTENYDPNGGTSDTYTYYYYNKNGWDNVQAHIWNGTTDLTGGWGSGKMTQINSTQWYYITFRSDIQPKYAIFHNGEIKDVNDVPIDSDATKVYYRSDINAGPKWWDGFVRKITITAGEGGTVKPAGVNGLTNGSSITATANEGYAFAGWTCSGGVGVADDKNAQTTLNATADGTLTASFAKIHQIVLHGTMQADGSVGAFEKVGQLVASEDNTTASLSVTLKEDTKYEFKLTIDGDWRGSNSIMTRGNSTDWDLNENYSNAGLKTDIAGTYTFTWTYATSRLTVTYPGYSVEIKSANTEQGTVSPAGIQGINEGETLTITATPKKGYMLDTTEPWSATEGITVRPTEDNQNEVTVSATQSGTVTANFVEDPNFADNPCVALHGNFTGEWKSTRMEISPDGKTATYTLNITGTRNKDFGIKVLKDCNGSLEGESNQSAWMWGDNSNHNISRTTNTLKLIEQNAEKTNGADLSMQVDIAGDYKFTYTYTTKTITVEYPSKEKYRLVYAEKKNDTYEKYHPSTPYIDALAEGATGVRRDTVSLHVRCSIPEYDRNSLQQIEKITGYKKTENDIFVYLQRWNGEQWETIQVLSDLATNASIAGKNGVYNFVVVQDPNAEEENKKVYIDEKIEAYKGNYYIRTNVAQGGWNDYKQTANQITYSDYAAQHKHFDHYWCKWVQVKKVNDGDQIEPSIVEGKVNLKFTIANNYSNCVSDTCTHELVQREFTDAEGRLGSNANVRWMWHSKTNDIDRAYIAGGDDCLFFVPKSESIKCKDKEGKETTGICAFTDRQNWTYKIDVTTPPNTKFAITKKPHGDAGDTRYCILGCETEGGETLILGTGIEKYDMRVVYDFKSDHLIYAWIPADSTINDPITLGSTVVCMRKDDGEATQVRFGKTGALNDVHEALGVLSLSKEYFWKGINEDNKWEREWYWISFPFDVCVSDIFSSFVFGQHYIIQDYDGASRAKYGCWADSPSYWRTLTRSDTLKAGKGYVLNIGHDEVEKIGGNPYLVDDKITELNIYFPSTGVTEITGAIQSVDVPKHPCGIKDRNRDIYDSNWNLIGVPTWVNIEDMPDGQEPGQPDNTDVSNIIINDGKTVGFYYHFNTGAKNGNTWTPRNVKEGEDKLVFKNMRSYLIQWAGTINWTNKSWDKTPSTQGLQARRAAEAKPEEYTLRLELSRGETALDQTFVRLQDDENITADYDMNYDMTKIINSGANVYTLIGTDLIQAGANVQPLPAENTTVYVPVGVVADKDGTYRFSMPDGTEGMLVSLADYETGMLYNLALGDYEVSLTAGTYEQRFVLEIQPKKNVTTGCNESTADEDTLRKVLIDGNLYIQRGDALYDAAGRAL